MKNDADDDLELTVDKFTFRFPKQLQYTEAGLWIRREGIRLRIGLSDFAQQRNGDIAFANLTEPGTVLEVDDELAIIETVKVNISLPSPVKGTIVEINPALAEAAELINQDPYGAGWMALIEPAEPNQPLTGVLDAHSYLNLARQQAETELKS